MQQTINTTQINECTIVGDVLDDTGDDGTFLQAFHQFCTFFAHRCFNNSTAGQDNIVTFTVEFDDLEFKGLAFIRGSVFHWAGIDQGTRKESTDAIGQDGQASLDLAVDNAGNDFARFHGFFKCQPRSQAFGLVTGQDCVTETVFKGFNGNRNEITDIDFDFADVVLEFINRNECFRLQARIDNYKIVVDADNFS